MKTMTQIYTEYAFQVNPKEPATEILIAELAEVGFESFDETEEGVLAYLLADQDRDDLLSEVNILNSIVFEITYQKKHIHQENWNAKWESNFQPIEINEKCRIRAPFHPEKGVDYEIIVHPKMAFGTGHHATTHLMIEYILQLDLQGKKVLDMGCGTGVLAILAALRKAASIDAIDVDPWSYENTKENSALNHIKNIRIFEGDSELLKGKSYDVILANINRNILLEDMKTYVSSLLPDGLLIMSGYYEKDLELIKAQAHKLGLQYQDHKMKDNWVASKFLKM